MMFFSLFREPKRDGFLIGLLIIIFFVEFFWPPMKTGLLIFGLITVIPNIEEAWRGIRERRITIDALNLFAVILSALMLEWRSVAFIALMLASARILETRTASKSRKAVEELLRLKPTTAWKEVNGEVKEISIGEVRVGDVLVLKTGSRVPVDGRIKKGDVSINEASVTGESVPKEHTVGDRVMSGTLVESGTATFVAERVGKETTVERLAALVKNASEHKSRSERLADRFAGLFLPAIIIGGIVVYFATRDLTLVIALLLVSCADDVAVAIPLAMVASIGQAAKRGVLVKGGEWIEALSRVDAIVLDKTGTLTYGSLSVQSFAIRKEVSVENLWCAIASAEKFSEHPAGRALYRFSAGKAGVMIPDPEEIVIEKGVGLSAVVKKHNVVIGNEAAFKERRIAMSEVLLKEAEAMDHGAPRTYVFVSIDHVLSAVFGIADVPRPEAAQSIRDLRAVGVKKVLMLTGDRQEVADSVADMLGITEFEATVLPERKLQRIESLSHEHTVAMVGDGMNDAAALARADVGIAMGVGGTAVTVEAADIVILTDNLSRVPEMIRLGKRTMSVIRGDIVIWIATNAIGMVLVLLGVFGPSLAALYNFLTDFVPLINSGRLFRNGRTPRYNRL